MERKNFLTERCFIQLELPRVFPKLTLNHPLGHPTACEQKGGGVMCRYSSGFTLGSFLRVSAYAEEGLGSDEWHSDFV